MEPTTIKIDDVEYVRKDRVTKKALNTDGLPYCIIRSYGAGVFAGYVSKRNDENRTVILQQCRRLWRWTGCSLSQVANDGTSGIDNKFSMETNDHEVFQVIEIIPCTEKAMNKIKEVAVWKK